MSESSTSTSTRIAESDAVAGSTSSANPAPRAVGRGLHEDFADLLDDVLDHDVTLCARALDRGEDLANSVDHGQQHICSGLVHRSPSVAQLGQQSLTSVREALEPAEPQEAARSLDGVDHPEDATE
jgi:hypothetical protein